MKHVNVLMSTYNGSKYIACQIDSILAQQGVDVSLTVRDDHSTDSTLKFIGSYAEKGLLSYSVGQNIGPARSFMQLLSSSPPSDYYAFSDQDDYWEPEKLDTAVTMLEPYAEMPSLYIGQTGLAAQDLSPLPYTPIHPLLTFGESLIYEFAAGCTMVMNKALRDIIVQYNPSFLKMHDVWVYSVALAIKAKVMFDPIPHIRYRQHGGNAVGQGYGMAETWRRRLVRLGKKELSRSRRAQEIANGFRKLIPSDNWEILSCFIEGKKSFSKRWSMLSDNRFKCGRKDVYRNFKLSLLLNQY